jgi:putative endonuclease
MSKTPCFCIFASGRNGTLYIGVTSELFERVSVHRQGLIDGFTKKYGVPRLVYYEMHETMDAAILREKRLKKWNRASKLSAHREHEPRVGGSFRQGREEQFVAGRWTGHARNPERTRAAR